MIGVKQTVTIVFFFRSFISLIDPSYPDQHFLCSRVQYVKKGKRITMQSERHEGLHILGTVHRVKKNMSTHKR